MRFTARTLINAVCGIALGASMILNRQSIALTGICAGVLIFNAILWAEIN